MPFGYTPWKTSPVAIDAAITINKRGTDLLDAVFQGVAPITIIAADISEHLGDNLTNSRVGRMISEWLGPNYQVVGRKKWSRKHGTESGSIFRYIGK